MQISQLDFMRGTFVVLFGVVVWPDGKRLRDIGFFVVAIDKLFGIRKMQCREDDDDADEFRFRSDIIASKSVTDGS